MLTVSQECYLRSHPSSFSASQLVLLVWEKNREFAYAKALFYQLCWAWPSPADLQGTGLQESCWKWLLWCFQRSEHFFPLLENHSAVGKERFSCWKSQLKPIRAQLTSMTLELLVEFTNLLQNKCHRSRTPVWLCPHCRNHRWLSHWRLAAHENYLGITITLDT